MDDSFTDYLASIGRAGGMSKSAAKRRAARQNAAKARRARMELRRKRHGHGKSGRRD